MNILVINGSPKGSRSNSLRLADAFVKGVSRQTDSQVEQLTLSKLDIAPCKGCFACWKATPGQCCIRDDMGMVLEKLLWADLIVYSFPLYYFNVPGPLKNLIDRQLPMVLPFMSERSDGVGSGSHEGRYDLSGKKYMLISTCGFYSAEGNYDSVCRMFDHICGKGNFDTLFCGQGELFRVKELSQRTDEYLQLVEKAGSEYASGSITPETRKGLEQLLFPRETFEAMADASWGVSKESGEKEDDTLIFTRQMAALYNKNSYDGKDRILEICYRDLGKTYQLLLGKEGCKVLTENFLTPTTRIDTPWDVWCAIARNELRGDEALAKQLYRVTGDFSLMIRWDHFFGGGEPAPKKESSPVVKKPPVMTTMLLAWISFWVAVSIDATAGAWIAIGVAACLPLIFLKHEIILWDKLSIATTTLLSVFTLATGESQLAVNLGYLIFGVMWLGSCFTKEPLCAAYVKYNYSGEDALNNPIFLKTNYILAAAWGILYVLTAVWTFFLAKTFLGAYLVVINNIMPAVMGIFTVWFEKWYPARVARGK